MSKIPAYINNRLKGYNKKESALKAGYSETVADKVKHNIEVRDEYAKIAERLITANSELLIKKIQDIKESDTLDTEDRNSMVALRIAQIQKILTPSVTVRERVRETKDKNGETKRTLWLEASKNIPQYQQNVNSESVKNEENATE